MVDILYAEDQPELSDPNREIMTMLGHNVTVAKNGSKAIDTLITMSGFDVLVTDYDMPGANGIDVIHAARQISKQPPVTICYTSSEIKRPTSGVTMIDTQPVPPGVIVMDKTTHSILDVVRVINDTLKELLHGSDSVR